MLNVVIVGGRERKDSLKDKEHVEALLDRLVQQHGSGLHVVSVGCDKGVGKVVREYCMSNAVKFVEVRVKFEGEQIERSFFAHMFLARNMTLLAVGDEYHIYRGPNENGIVEGLIGPAQNKVKAERVFVYLGLE